MTLHSNPSRIYS